MSFLQGGVAVVTGAGSGIGRALAQRLSAVGSALAIADIDEKGLAETAASLATTQALLSTHVLDVSDEAAVKGFAEEVVARHGRVTLLINNAGVALHGTFEEISLDDLRWLMGINFWGIVHGVKYFLPDLKQQPRAHIVNLSSVFGIIAPVGQSAYSASKFAVRGFTESSARTGRHFRFCFVRSSRGNSYADRKACATGSECAKKQAGRGGRAI